MKKNIKRIITPALMALAFGSVTVGGTFALFTDRAETEITVQSGKVDINSTASNLTAYSMDPADNTKEVTRTDGTFYNGGTYTLANQTLTLERITPGDRVQFDLASENASNVAIKYRFAIQSSGSEVLLGGLVIKINDEDYSPTYAQDWTFLAASAALPTDKATMHVSVSLPKDRGDEYQNLSASLVFAFQAIQGNAEVA